MTITRRIEQYLGSEGQRIEALIASDATTREPATEEQMQENNLAEPLIVYVGVARIMSSIPTPNGPVPAIPHEVRFPLPADNLVDAFACYQSEFDAFIEGLREEQQKAAEQAQKQANEELYIPNAAESQAINNMKLVTPDDA